MSEYIRHYLCGVNSISRKYFTALVNEHGDKRRPVRQQVYWSALNKYHSGKIEIIKGKFNTYPRVNRIAKYQFCEGYNKQGKKVKNTATENSICVMRPEEKRSDVNLAVHLVNDAWRNLYDTALIISNDSDLAESIVIVKQYCNKEVVLANPFMWKRTGIASELKKLNLISRKINEKQLQSCQLPSAIPGTNIRKPYEWEQQYKC